MILNAKEPNGVMKNFPLTNCHGWSLRLANYSGRIQRTQLFLDLYSIWSGRSLLIVNLMTLSNNSDNGHCTPIKEVYFGKYKTYIYRIEDDRTLKRWLVTPEGTLTNPYPIATIKHVRYFFIKLVNLTFS